MLNKIGVIGDIHAEPERLNQSLTFLQQFDLDVILCTGDIVDGRGDVDECVRLLQKFDVKTVLGNHDAWFLKNSMRSLTDATPVTAVTESTMDYIRNLPVELEMDTSAGTILLCHGLGKHLMAKVGADDYGYALESNFELQDLISSHRYRFVINGHTHHRMVRDFSGLTVINAGSLLYADASFQTVDFCTGLITVFGPDAPEKSSINIRVPGILI